MTIAGMAPQGSVLQASSNLQAWVSLTTNSLSGGRFDYTNSRLIGVPFLFYRACGLPRTYLRALRRFEPNTVSAPNRLSQITEGSGTA